MIADGRPHDDGRTKEGKKWDEGSPCLSSGDVG